MAEYHQTQHHHHHHHKDSATRFKERNLRMIEIRRALEKWLKIIAVVVMIVLVILVILAYTIG